MLQPRKPEQEGWPEFRQRTIRQARCLVHRYLPDRWSSQWLSRWWGYCGHTARGLREENVPGASLMNNFRNAEWWDEQQRMLGGARHSGRFFPKLAPLDKAMNSLFAMPWRQAACDRDLWKSKCQHWVLQQDVPWCSGTQFALTW